MGLHEKGYIITALAAFRDCQPKCNHFDASRHEEFITVAKCRVGVQGVSEKDVGVKYFQRCSIDGHFG